LPNPLVSARSSVRPHWVILRSGELTIACDLMRTVAEYSRRIED
jgi:hypothetical protein